MTFAIASTLMGLPGVQGQNNELPPPPLIPVDTTKGVDWFAAVLQAQPPSQDGLQDKLPVAT